MKTKPTGTPHVFTADPETPGDPISSAQVCRWCHLVGRPGDAHHTLPDVPEQADVLRRYEPETTD